MKYARIKNLREFIPLAVIYGYELYDVYLVKTLYFSPDEEVCVKINVNTGLIQLHHYCNNCELNDLSIDDQKYFLKDIDYLVEWVEIDNDILRRMYEWKENKRIFTH